MTSQHTVRVGDHDRGHDLWVEERGAGDPGTSPVLLVMGAASSALVWPDALVDRLAARRRVVRWDHRDTGRSTAVPGSAPYAVRDLAQDAVAVLDALEVGRAHVVGMSMGGLLTQLLLLDHPERLRSATLFCTGPLGGAPGGDAPGPHDDLLAFWATMPEERDDDAELDWRVRHWLLLNAGGACDDPAEWRELEQRVAVHAGGLRSALPHATADQSGLERGAGLGAVQVPTLVVEAPHDPAYPPPSAALLAGAVGTAGGVPARLVTVPDLGHALGSAVVAPFAAALERHLEAAEGEAEPGS